MSRNALEKTALRLLKSRMEQRMGTADATKGGVLFKIEELQQGMPEIISEETFVELLEMNIDQMDELLRVLMMKAGK